MPAAEAIWAATRGDALQRAGEGGAAQAAVS
jgi:hypothetical protein